MPRIIQFLHRGEEHRDDSLVYYENKEEFYYKPQTVKEWYYEWDFKGYNPNIYSHGFHQYPAKFIPQLARKLLRVFTN